MFEEIRKKCRIDLERRCSDKEEEKNIEMMNLLIGEGLGEIGSELSEIVSIYISKANRIRKRYVSN